MSTTSKEQLSNLHTALVKARENYIKGSQRYDSDGKPISKGHFYSLTHGSLWGGEKGRCNSRKVQELDKLIAKLGTFIGGLERVSAQQQESYAEEILEWTNQRLVFFFTQTQEKKPGPYSLMTYVLEAMRLKVGNESSIRWSSLFDPSSQDEVDTKHFRYLYFSSELEFGEWVASLGDSSFGESSAATICRGSLYSQGSVHKQFTHDIKTSGTTGGNVYEYRVDLAEFKSKEGISFEVISEGREGMTLVVKRKETASSFQELFGSADGVVKPIFNEPDTKGNKWRTDSKEPHLPRVQHVTTVTEAFASAMA